MRKPLNQRKKRLYLNRKSCTAAILALALIFASVSSIRTQAEEPGSGSSAPEIPSMEEQPAEPGADGQTAYVRTPEGAVIITSFAPLSDEQAQLTPEGWEALAEITARMPETLRAYAVAVSDADQDGGEDQDGGDEDQDGSGGENQDGGDEDQNGSGGEDQNGGDEDQNGNGDEDQDGGDEDQNGSGDEDQNGSGDEDQDGSGDEDQDGGDEDQNGSGDEDQDGDNHEDQSETDNGVTFGMAGRNGRWHLLVETESGNTIEDTGDDEGDGQPGEGDDGQSSAGPVVQAVEVEIPVVWECAEYEEEEQREKQSGEERELDRNREYIFFPKWDETAWYYDTEAEGASVPTITVRFADVKNQVFGSEAEVSTEEELTEAFAAGVGKITLKNDIMVTKPLVLPETANIRLDGQGHSLRRGEAAEDGAPYTGIMIDMSGLNYTRDIYGTLTLLNIVVDGSAASDRAAAPAIWDDGHLFLEEGAGVSSNRNYGTYAEDGSGSLVCEINEFGGGIRVKSNGILTVKQGALVTENFAELRGGGVYLDGGAALYLHADVIRDNSVPAQGVGADIYAAKGSTIYYDPSIDLTDEARFYISEGATLIPLGRPGPETPPEDGAREVYISVSRDSGYSEADVLLLKQKLSELGYKVLANKITYIDTTDLRDWYVYDHYDTAFWRAEGETAVPPQKWTDEYGDQVNRKYYECDDTNADQTNAPTTIEDWMTNGAGANGGELVRFKEHIWTRKENGYPTMTFVGYGHPSYVDFLFYDPESDGEKVVEFDVDSSRVYSHTLTGSGFLVNTSVENGKLQGYLVYYEYEPNKRGAKAQSVTIYQLNGVDVQALHNGSYDFQREKGPLSMIASYPIDSYEWQSKMSVRIKATPDSIEVWQQPNGAGGDLSQSAPVLSCKLETGSRHSGFGPLVAYTAVGHSCSQSSSFTYSNLRMYFTNPMLEMQDMLSPLEGADFTQNGTQKYFINLFGDSDQSYNDEAHMGQYQEYLKMMQQEGIALITDRDTPFEEYLGEANGADTNLFELERGGRLSVDELAEKIRQALESKTSTSLKEKVSETPGEGYLMPAEPKESIGNIWLKSLAGSGQVRTLWGDMVGEDGYGIQIMDDISYYHGNAADCSVTYKILRPGRFIYEELATAGGNEPVTFTLNRDDSLWPSGQYTVQQTITDPGKGACKINGYAYFNLSWGSEPKPPEDPDTPIPAPPMPEPPESDPAAPSGGPSPGPIEPPAEYSGESVEITANAPVQTAAVEEAAKEPEKKPGEPKTGDMPIPALPVSVGACTAFAMKLRLWLYELEAGISEEKKNEILRAIISWAKDTNRVKVCLAIAATAVVVTLFHLLKTVNDGRRRVVALFER